MQSETHYISVEYAKDDTPSVTEDDKCKLCNFKYAAITNCCGIKLCTWHIRDNGEHADQGYYSCSTCETHEKVNDGKGFITIFNTIYCEDHNKMKFFDVCYDHMCDKHESHDCERPIEYCPYNINE